MRIDIQDPRAGMAVAYIKETHSPKDAKELEQIFEKVYHCKIVSTDAPFHTQGYVEISEDKYQTWFLVQFGGSIE